MNRHDRRKMKNEIKTEMTNLNEETQKAWNNLLMVCHGDKKLAERVVADLMERNIAIKKATVTIKEEK